VFRNKHVFAEAYLLFPRFLLFPCSNSIFLSLPLRKFIIMWSKLLSRWTNDFLICHYIILYGVHCYNDIRNTRQSWPTLLGWKTVLLTIWNDLLQSSLISRQQLTLIMCCCSWWTFWTLCLNAEWANATDMHNWNVWTVCEKLCKVWFVICEYSMCNCMFTWKIEL